MTRKLIALPDDATSGEFTHQFIKLYERNVELTGVDLIIDYGITAAERDTDPKFLFKEDSIRDSDKIITEAYICFTVDNFQTYLTDILVDIHGLHPEIISSSSTRNSTIFEVDNLEELKRRVVEKHVSDLAYKSIDELGRYFQEKLNVTFTSSQFNALRLNRLIQIRNLITHNRGIVNQFFLSKVGCKIDRAGSPVRLPNPHAIACFFVRLAARIDRQVKAKYKLEGRRLLTNAEAAEEIKKMMGNA